MTLQPLVVLAAPASALAEGLELMVVGLAVVFSALLLLCGTVVLLGRATRQAALAAPAAPPPAPAQPAPQPAEEGIPPEIIAILVAAATAAIGSPVRLRSARLAAQDPAAHVWAEHGRIRIHQSHRPRTGR